jgi:hypothetical protein
MILQGGRSIVTPLVALSDRSPTPMPQALTASPQAGGAEPNRARERAWVLAVAVVLTALRSATLVGFEGARFDSDQALIGLMAKHLIEGRAFPVFTYGQPYMLGVEAWLAAPFIWAGGLTVTMLKLPLLFVNVAVSVLLVRLLEREAGLRPALALVPALFFILVAPGTATLLLEASGGNVEPFLMVLLLWMVRRRPWTFGALLAFGMLQREFTVYALGGLAVLRLADRSLLDVRAWRSVIAGAVSFGAVWQGIYLLKQFSSISGPGTSARWAPLEASANLAAVAGRVCVGVDYAVAGLTALVTSHIANVLGASHEALNAFTINSAQGQGAAGLWPVLGVAFALMAAAIAWQAARGRAVLVRPPFEFPAYLLLVGVQAFLVHALTRCGVLSLAELRYSLLGVFAAVGLVTLFLQAATTRTLKAAAIGVVMLWTVVTAAAHTRFAAEYVFHTPFNARRALADTLLEQGVRFAYADFWESYIVSFYTNEQVIVASTSYVFIDEYQWLVERQADEAVHIRREPCPGGTDVAEWLYICPPGS